MGKRRKRPEVDISTLPTYQERAMAIRTRVSAGVVRSQRAIRSVERLIKDMQHAALQMQLAQHTLWSLQRDIERLLDDIEAEAQQRERQARLAIN